MVADLEILQLKKAGINVQKIFNQRGEYFFGGLVTIALILILL